MKTKLISSITAGCITYILTSFLLILPGYTEPTSPKTAVALAVKIKGTVTKNGFQISNYYPLYPGDTLQVGENSSLVVDYLSGPQQVITGPGTITIQTAGCLGNAHIEEVGSQTGSNPQPSYSHKTNPAPPSPPTTKSESPSQPKAQTPPLDARITRSGPFPGPPFFTWEFTNEAGAASTPYELRVLESPTGNVIWRQETETTRLSYNGPPLELDHRYYVQIRSHREVESDKPGDIVRFRILSPRKAAELRSKANSLRKQARKKHDPQALLTLMELYDKNDIISKEIDTGLEALDMPKLTEAQFKEVKQRLARLYKERFMEEIFEQILRARAQKSATAASQKSPPADSPPPPRPVKELSGSSVAPQTSQKPSR